MLSKVPIFRAFNLAIVQLGGVCADKSKNLSHAREMVLKAAATEGGTQQKPDLIVLPVRGWAKPCTLLTNRNAHHV
jgi:omega-amidase